MTLRDDSPFTSMYVFGEVAARRMTPEFGVTLLMIERADETFLASLLAALSDRLARLVGTGDVGVV